MASATGSAFAEEVARVRKAKRHAIAMTPLASVPLDCSKQDFPGRQQVIPERRRPVVITKSPGQTMRYPKRPAIYDR